MNDLDLLKKLHDDVAPPSARALAQARRQLVTPPSRSPWRLVVAHRRALLAGALALTLAGGFLVTDVVKHDGAPPLGAVADAGTFLADAASASIAEPDAPIPPGQFLKITFRSTRLTPLGSNPGLRATEYGERDTWIAADRKAPYPTLVSWMSRVDFATPEARELAQTKAKYLFHTTTPSLMLNSCPTIGSGVIMFGAMNCRPTWQNTTFEFLAAQPRDPDALLAALRRNPTPQTPDEAAFDRIGWVLSTGVVPADLRAALYQAARKIPGIKLLDDVVTVDGRRARVIARDGDGYRDDLLIAETGGQFLGTRIAIIKDGPPDINGKPERSLQAGDILYSAIAGAGITSTPPPTK
ncbi:CU044_5270 family protein [Kribbella sp. CA-245084]|uniref:CU044_5270 family protein n=1 Tax=Kribbella sp. CA-245084 TaxID=3239940 RepID=UPI003D8A1B21